jgi:outer membrane protein TolC
MSRGDIAAAEFGVKAMEKGKQETWFRFAPTISAAGSYQYSDWQEFAHGQNWWIMLNASWVLYDGGLRYADMRERTSGLNEARLNLESLRASAKSQVRQTLLDIDNCSANMASAGRQTELAMETYRVAKANFDQGLSTSMDVTDAGTTLVTARTNLAREELNCQLSRIKLMKATGEILEIFK